MQGKLYPYAVKNEERNYLLVWFSDDLGDRFLKNGNDLLVGSDKESINQQLGEKMNLVSWSDLASIDIDKLFKDLERVSRTHTSDESQNSLFLNGWNFFEDLIRTFGLENNFLKYRTSYLDKVYDKLFWGCNLPSVTPIGKSYSPIWESREIEALTEYMNELRRVLILKIAK